MSDQSALTPEQVSCLIKEHAAVKAFINCDPEVEPQATELSDAMVIAHQAAAEALAVPVAITAAWARERLKWRIEGRIEERQTGLLVSGEQRLNDLRVELAALERDKEAG